MTQACLHQSPNPEAKLYGLSYLLSYVEKVRPSVSSDSRLVDEIHFLPTLANTVSSAGELEVTLGSAVTLPPRPLGRRPERGHGEVPSAAIE